MRKCWPVDDVGPFPEDPDEDIEMSEEDIEKVEEACDGCAPVCKSKKLVQKQKDNSQVGGL